MYVLKRLLALVLGITVLPLRALAYNTFYEVITLLLSIAVVISLPIRMASTFKENGISTTNNFLLTTLVIFPLVTVLTGLAFAAASAFLVYNTVMDMLESFWLGFKNGLLYEIEGFWNAYNVQSLRIANFSSQFRAFQSGIDPEDLIDDVDFDGFQRIRGELQDVVVVHEDLEVPDLESQSPKVDNGLLNDTQLEKVNQLINELSHLKEPLTPQVKRQLDDLKTLYAQYNDLAKKLEDVRTALVDNDKARIKDELIAFNDVELPILLVKQYKKENKWYHVPANSYVTDKETLVHWLKQNPKHPLNKDLLKNPEPYNKMEARYTWYELTKDDCSSQELTEAAAKMDVLARALLPMLSSMQKINLGLGSAPQSFFGTKASNSLYPATHLEGSLSTQCSEVDTTQLDDALANYPG